MLAAHLWNRNYIGGLERWQMGFDKPKKIPGELILLKLWVKKSAD